MMRFFRLRRKQRAAAAAAAAGDDNTTSRSLAEARLRLPQQRTRPKRSSLALTDPSTSNDGGGAGGGGGGGGDHSNESFSTSSANGGEECYNNNNDDDSVVVVPDLSSYEMNDLIIGELLGQGTFATVHAIVCFTTVSAATSASRTGNNMFATDLALKRLHGNKEFANPQAVVADLATEAWILHRLPHKHMVGLHALVDDGPMRKALVVDRLVSTLRDERRRWYKWAPQNNNNNNSSGSGSRVDLNLWRLLRPKTYQHVETLRTQVAVDLTSALQHLHAHGICHRDVKPSNIGFNAKGVVKLFDFGFCRSLPAQADEIHDKDKHQQALYRLTVRMGTWRYMAPEVARGEAYNLKCDVYSLALVLWEILVGRKPYGTLENASEELRQLVTKGTFPSLNDIDPAWQPLVAQAGHANVQDRWTMAQVYQGLIDHQTKLQTQQQSKNSSTGGSSSKGLSLSWMR